jgi:Tol biopolymer transport system component/outer membrane protein OmpA-like peptidoglycan-associated protein
VTVGSGMDIDPAWSPDGSRIAFQSDRDGDPDVYVMNADGSDVRQLTNSPGFDGAPSWSPDGTRIAFASERTGNSDVFVMGADGSGQTPITQTPGFDSRPAWSPDGSRIAFESDRDGNIEMYAAAPDGSGPTRLTTYPEFDGWANWLASGAGLAIGRDVNGNGDVVILSPDGRSAVNLTNSPGVADSRPAPAPDGSRIAYASKVGGVFQIFTMAPDGSGVRQVTTGPQCDFPDWGSGILRQAAGPGPSTPGGPVAVPGPGSPVDVEGLSAGLGLPGALVTLTGKGFGARQGPSVIAFRGVPAGVATWRDDRVDAFVPNLTPGPAEITLTVGGAASERIAFRVLAVPPPPPTANPVVLPEGGRTIAVDATLSVDAAGPLGKPSAGQSQSALITGGLKVLWNFGDGETSNRAVATHAYREPGNYLVRLRVTSPRGLSSTQTTRVRIAPRATTRAQAPVRIAPVNLSIPSRIVFDFGGSALRPESGAYLRRVARVARRGASVRVTGYTDSIGPAPFNLALSRRRARVVAGFLVRSGGVRAGRMRTAGLGEGHPVASNRTELGRQRNRRVEITVRLPAGVRRF